MSDDPEGDGVECEVEPADWEVRVGPSNNPTQREREWNTKQLAHRVQQEPFVPTFS